MATDAGPTADSRTAKVEAILDAAMHQFSQRGYAKTSMAAIAEAAGVSRPALYQFFDNREDVFRSGLTRVLLERNTEALAALEADGPLIGRLDGFLQRRFGDAVEMLQAMPYADEIMDARLSVAPDIGHEANRFAGEGLEAVLGQHYPEAAVRQAVDLLQFGPLGMKSDHPDLETYRSRLTTLATAAAALLNGP